MLILVAPCKRIFGRFIQRCITQDFRRPVKLPGAKIVSDTEVQTITNNTGDFEVATSRGQISCKNIFIATNGYTTPGLNWWHRRVVPVPSQILATEEIGNNLMRQLIPKGRMVVESNLLFHFFRPSPDGKRLLVGGRHGGNAKKRTDGLLAVQCHLAKVMPELADIKFHTQLGWIHRLYP